jgi:hypothetical protein
MNTQYQVLALGKVLETETFAWFPGYRLGKDERNSKKNITSLVVL